MTYYGLQPSESPSHYSNGIPIRRGERLEVTVTGEIVYSIYQGRGAERAVVSAGPSGTANSYGVDLHADECPLGAVIAVTFDVETRGRVAAQCLGASQVFAADQDGRIGFYLNASPEGHVSIRSGSFRVSYARSIENVTGTR